MSMSGSGDELKLPLRIDTSQVESDLRAVDKELARLEQRVVRTFNRLGSVRGGTAARAESLGDVRKELSGMADPDLRAAMLALRAPLQSYGARSAALTAQAAAGRGTLPPTATQAAAARLAQVERQGKPLEIDARNQFFDKMTQSLRRGLGGAPAILAAQGGIPGAAGAARALMGLAGGNPLLAAGVGGAAALGAGALAANAMQAGFQRQQANLASALVGGPAFGATRTALGLGVMHTGAALGATPAESAAIAQQLASYGMQSGQLTANERNVLLMSKGLGLQPGDVTPLVGALSTAGGMNPGQIANVLRELNDVSDGTTGSLQKLTQAAAALGAVNPLAARDAASVAALSRVVGPTSGINAGALMAPAMGAVGTSAIGAAAILGMPLNQYVKAQRTPGGTARIFDAASAFMRSMPHDETGRQTGLQVLAQMGIIDPGQLKANQFQDLGAIMQNAPRGRAYAYWLQASKPRPGRPRTLTGEAKPLIGPQTSWQDQARINWDNMITDWLSGPTPRSPRGVISGPMTPHGGGGKFGMHTLPAGVVGAVQAAAGGGDVAHTLHVKVTVQDQRGRELGHAVDHTRVVAGARTALRPPHDRTGALDTPYAQQLPGRWNEGW